MMWLQGRISVAGKQRIFTLTAWRTKSQASKLSKKKGQQTVSLKAREEGKNLAQVARWSLNKEGSRGRHTEQQHKVSHLVSQTTLSDFWKKNLEELSPTEKEEAIDDQIRSMDSHEKEHWSDLRADTGTSLLLGKIVMEQQQFDTFSESILEQGDKELWIRRASWRFDQWPKLETDSQSWQTLDSDGSSVSNSTEWVKVLWWTDYNYNKFSQHDGYQEKVQECRWWRTVSRKEILGAGRWRMGASCKQARSTRAGVSDEVAQEFQVIPNGNANIECPQVNFQNEISDPDEFAKAANVTALREAEKTDFSLKTRDEKRSRVANPTPPDPGSSFLADLLVTLPDRSCVGDPYELDRPQYYVFDRGSTLKQKVYQLEKCMDEFLQLIRLCPLRDTEHSMSIERIHLRAEHDDSRRWLQYSWRWRPSADPWVEWIRRTTQPIFSRNILTDCVHEHSRRNWDYAFWMWLMMVRTGTTDDDNCQLLTSVCSWAGV